MKKQYKEKANARLIVQRKAIGSATRKDFVIYLTVMIVISIIEK